MRDLTAGVSSSVALVLALLLDELLKMNPEQLARAEQVLTDLEREARQPAELRQATISQRLSAN